MLINGLKKLRAVPLLLAVILAFSGCSADFLRSVPLPFTRDFVEVEGDLEKEGGLVDAVFSLDRIVMLRDGYSEGENGAFFLYEIDAKKAKITKSTEITDCALDIPYGLDTDENGDIVCFGYEEKSDGIKALVFSVETLETDGKITDYTPSAKNIDGADTALGLSLYEGEYASLYTFEITPGKYEKMFVRRSDPDTAVYTDIGDFSCCESFENLAAGMDFADPDSENESDRLLIYDLENHTLVNELAVDENPSDDITKSVLSVYINQNYAFVFLQENTETGDGESSGEKLGFYIWKYRKYAVDMPVEMTEKSVDDIALSSDGIRKRIKADYGIEIFINSSDFDFYKKGEDYYLAPEASRLKANILLKQIAAFLRLLPDGFVKEMYNGMDLFSYTGFEIYIGSEITGNSGAYTMAFTDKLTIVFATETSDFRTVAHEFMHAIDPRLEDFLGVDDSLYENWIKLNPDGFEYSGYTDDGVYNLDEELEPYFVSAYAGATDAEDRAELFSALVVDSFSDREADKPYKENAPLRKKAEYLVGLISKAYDSVDGSGETPWEKALNG